MGAVGRLCWVIVALGVRWTLKDFRCGSGDAIDYPLHAKIRLLEFLGNCPEYGLEVDGVVDNYGRGLFKSSVGANVDCCSDGAEFFIEFVFEVFHEFGEVFFGDEHVDLCSHSVYTMALRHWMWHHPACLLVWGWLLVSKLTLTMF